MSVTSSPQQQQDAFQPKISVSKYDDVMINLNEKLGKWTYGDYYKGFSKKLGKDLMVKMVDLTKFPLKKNCLDTEIELLQKLKISPYVVQFMEYKYYKKSLVITTECYNGGDLRSYLKKNGRIPEDQAIRLLMQLVCGLKALHKLNYTHAAVRPENILLHEEEGRLTLKLSNFIFARQYDGDNTAKFPMPFDSLYLAPEVLRDEVYHPTSDIWSIGVIFYEMLYGTFPWTGRTKEELRDNIINKSLDLTAGDGVSDTSIEFLYRCLHRDVDKRLDWKGITEHRLLFRALFMNEDGTYRLYNDEFKEFSPSRKNLMFGIRMAGGSLPGTPKSNRSESPFRTSTNKGFMSASKAVDLNASGMSGCSSPFNLKAEQTPKSSKSRSPSPKNLKFSEFAPEGVRDREASPIKIASLAPQGEAAPANETKKSDPEFYSRFVSKVGDSNDYYLSKFLNKESIETKCPFSKKNFAKPFKWLANKAEILGEIYELAIKNRQHCCYDKILKLLNEENSSWNTIDLASVMQKQFMETVESNYNKEDEKSMLWPKQIKANLSLAKKEKSQQIASLIEEIVASLTNNSENAKGNNEELLQIAADLKVLREFDEIGDNIMKELNAMKNALIVFYRKKDHTHIRYMLLVRNLA